MQCCTVLRCFIINLNYFYFILFYFWSNVLYDHKTVFIQLLQEIIYQLVAGYYLQDKWSNYVCIWGMECTLYIVQYIVHLYIVHSLLPYWCWALASINKQINTWNKYIFFPYTRTCTIVHCIMCNAELLYIKSVNGTVTRDGFFLLIRSLLNCNITIWAS